MNNPFLAFFVDLGLRLKAKNPKFFNTLQWITGLIGGILGLILIGNVSFGWGLGEILLIKIPLTDLFGYLIVFFGAVFGGSQLAVSNTSDTKYDLTYKHKIDEPPELK